MVMDVPGGMVIVVPVEVLLGDAAGIETGGGGVGLGAG
jgi:hypothetical protein